MTDIINLSLATQRIIHPGWLYVVQTAKPTFILSLLTLLEPEDKGLTFVIAKTDNKLITERPFYFTNNISSVLRIVLINEEVKVIIAGLNYVTGYKIIYSNTFTDSTLVALIKNLHEGSISWIEVETKILKALVPSDKFLLYSLEDYRPVSSYDRPFIVGFWRKDAKQLVELLVAAATYSLHISKAYYKTTIDIYLEIEFSYENHSILRMRVFNRKTNTYSVEYQYSFKSGDSIIINPKTSNKLHNLLGRLWSKVFSCLSPFILYRIAASSRSYRDYDSQQIVYCGEEFALLNKSLVCEFRAYEKDSPGSNLFMAFSSYRASDSIHTEQLFNKLQTLYKLNNGTGELSIL